MSAPEETRFVSLAIDGQSFGIPVHEVREVLQSQRLTRVPMAPRGIAGLINLRGRVVIVVDVRALLGLPPSTHDKHMQVVVERGGELYSLQVDHVGEVMELSAGTFERNPAALDRSWRNVSTGNYRLEGRLLVALDLERLLAFDRRQAG